MKLPEHILGYECRHIMRFDIPQSDDEYLYIKRIAHHKDGKLVPEVKLVKNFQRHFYVTKEDLRNHKEIRTAEKIKHTQRFTCTERVMARQVAKALRVPLKKHTSMKKLSESPYLYGSDVSSATIMKHKYQTAFPDLASENTLAVLDIETDVVHGTEDILSISVTMKDKAALIVNTQFLAKNKENVAKIQEAMDKYLGETVKQRNIKLKVLFCDTPGQCVKKAIDVLHHLQPDFAGIYNIDFDMPKMIKALEKENYDLAAVFSDPSLPPKLRYFEYDRGDDFMITSSGVRKNFTPWEKWHTVRTPSSFYWVDIMGVYAFIRKASGYLPSYKLDYVLEKELKTVRKLSFTFADGYEGIEWHQFMQDNYKVEYLIYNLFDTIGCELLDEKTKDLQLTLPELTGVSEYATFNSTPKQLADDLHFYYLSRGEVFCSKGKMGSDLDDHTISLSGHIITLPTHLVEDNGLNIIQEMPDVHSLMRGSVSD